MRVEPSERPGSTRALRLAKVFLAMLGILALGFFGAFAPVLSPLVYPHLAPSGWRNITPHANTFDSSYAASVDDPGLVMECGVMYFLDTQENSQPHLYYWISRDGGAHWRMLNPPFGTVGQKCELAMPAGERDTIFVTIDSTIDGSYSLDNVATEWVSHDAGATWRQIKSASVNSGAGSQIYGPNAYFRHGVLYDYGQPDGWSNAPLTYSMDDSRSWIPISSALSKLEQQGWAIDDYSTGPMPDYRGATWWFRVVSLDGKPPELEHSTDDGHSWSAVGPIGTTSMQSVTLAVTPLDSGAICAVEHVFDSGTLRVFSSSNAGVTWRQGKVPATLDNMQSDGSVFITIGAHGDCYVNYSYAKAPGFTDSGSAVLRLPPGSADMRVIWQGSAWNTAEPLFVYIPAGNGMSSRLIMQSAATSLELTVLSQAAGETTDTQLAWIAVP